jgi:hypothetical protein
MSQWDNFDGGRMANANTQRLIDASKAEDRRRAMGWVCVVLLILVLLALFTMFEVRVP